MNSEAHQKVQAEHLLRNAFLYVRQSTLRQVRENIESSQRQYGLRDRALALGWTTQQIVIIDCDQGQSGSSAVEREGFQRLVAEVSMNRAGIVMGLEVSRLARNSSDWHRLLEICGVTRTLLLDEDGLYDPSHFNDRLLLGLKGTMSEVELHLIRARLRGGFCRKPGVENWAAGFRQGWFTANRAEWNWTRIGKCRRVFFTYSEHFDAPVLRLRS